MEVSNVSIEVFNGALALAQGDLADNLEYAPDAEPRPLNKAETRWKVRVRPAWSHETESRPAIGVRLGAPDYEGRQRRIRASCGPAYGAYILGIFDQAPGARVKTAFATYKDVYDFEAKYGDVLRGNVNREPRAS